MTFVDSAAVTTGEDPVTPNGMLRGIWTCNALTHTATSAHSKNRTTASATRVLFPSRPLPLTRSFRGRMEEVKLKKTRSLVDHRAAQSWPCPPESLATSHSSAFGSHITLAQKASLLLCSDSHRKAEPRSLPCFASRLAGSLVSAKCAARER